MINSWKMLKACQEQDFNPEAAKPTFSHVNSTTSIQRGASATQHHTLLSTSSHCQVPGAAQAPAAQSGADWERGAKAGRA